MGKNKGIVKVVGFLFLFAFIVPTLNWALILSRFIAPNDALKTGKNIVLNEPLFRYSISIELIMSIGLVILGVLLYEIMKSVNKNIALLALSLKLVEAGLAVVITLVSFVSMLAVIDTNGHFVALNQEMLQEFAGFVLQRHKVLYALPMVFLGLDMMLFSYLFFKSRYIPRPIAGFGIISFALIFIHALLYIIAPDYAALPRSQIIFWSPSGLFEIIIGIWLLLKGIKVESPSSADITREKLI